MRGMAFGNLYGTRRFSYSVFAIVAICCLTTALLVLSVPRVLASFTSFSGGAELRALQELKPVDRKGLEIAKTALQARLQWVSSPRMASDLALVSGKLYDETSQAAYLRTTERALGHSLSGGPANAYAWARLAIARDKAVAAPSRVRDALVMSIYTGPHEPRLVAARLALISRYASALTAEDWNLVRQQVQYSMVWGVRRDVLALARRNARLRSIVRVMLSSDPESLQAFDRALRNSRR